MTGGVKALFAMSLSWKGLKLTISSKNMCLNFAYPVYLVSALDIKIKLRQNISEMILMEQYS